MIANYTGLFIIRLDDWQIVGQVEIAGDEFIIKKFLDDLKSKLPFKKKLTDEEEEYEDYEDEEEIEDLGTSNDERTQFVNTSDLEDDGYEYEEYEDEDEDEEEEGDENEDDASDGIKGKILNALNQIKSLVKKKSKASDEEDDEVESDDVTEANIQKPAKNKNKLIVQGVIVLCLVYFVADEFMKDDVPEEVPQLKARPDQVPTTDVEDQIPVEDIPPAVVEDAPIEDTSVTESDVGTDTETTETETTETETNFEDTSAPIVDTPPETNDWEPDETITEDFTPPDVSDNQVGGQVEGNIDIYGDLASPIEDGGGDLTEKILQDLESQSRTAVESPAEYVAPPDYEYPGRGLVYNCKALHWACVDGPSYKVCEQNATYLQDNKQAPECYPFNIYETSHGCTSMQNRMVSSGANADFCKGF